MNRFRRARAAGHVEKGGAPPRWNAVDHGFSAIHPGALRKTGFPVRDPKD
jgi:hypothetical protein